MARPSVRAAYVSIVAIIVNPNNPQADDQLRELLDAAHTVGVQVEPFKGSSPSDTAFATLAERRAGGLVMAADAFFNTRKEQFIVLSARHALPAAFPYREFPAAGGLMSYGTSLTDAYRQEGIYAGRI
jgi:putative ABC transport system substrate-binding protein